MKKALLIVIVCIFGLFIIIQFFQPNRNIAPITEDDIFAQVKTPDSIKNKIIASCYDCHSNQTKYPWYNKVAPLSWMIADHIQNGKEELNFSVWGTLSKREQLGVLNGISSVLEDKSMPLPSYLKLHNEARFSIEETEAITSWTEVTMEALFE